MRSAAAATSVSGMVAVTYIINKVKLSIRLVSLPTIH